MLTGLFLICWSISYLLVLTGYFFANFNWYISELLVRLLMCTADLLSDCAVLFCALGPWLSDKCCATHIKKQLRCRWPGGKTVKEGQKGVRRDGEEEEEEGGGMEAAGGEAESEENEEEGGVMDKGAARGGGEGRRAEGARLLSGRGWS